VEKPQIFRSPTAVVVWVVWLLFAVANWIDLAVQGRDHLSVVAAAVLLLATGVVYVTAQRPRIIADDAGVTVRNPLRDHRIGWAGVAQVDLVDLLRVHCAWGPGGSGGEGSPPGSGGSRGVAPQEQQHQKVISAWAIHYSRRRQFAAEARARRGARRSASAGPAGFGRSYGSGSVREPASSAEAEAEKIVKLLQARATAARAEAVWADSTVEIAGAPPAPDPTETAPASDTASATAPAATTTMAATGWTEPLTSTWSRRALAALLIPALILLIVILV
jgi:PH (Pleckstrin Homology) domain-containing protein